MKGTQEDLERQVKELRAQVAALRKTIINGFIVLGIILAIGCVPGLGLIGMVLGAVALVVVVFVLFFGTIGAALGWLAGHAVRAVRRPPASAPPLP
jgi:uncharacterized membrane protein